ncbi:hypothetical protein [Streptomyces fuscichromogenes]|uniref:Uncharacterized protein n=1 Tax=Streptomyces fuscichromogenes TaxID=1324013 RepID=A0A917XJ40_9ACTN|nr:hypothetical protein [Streptomyces fuscichromogenes]GGN29938.1 hypothetical protein GCM10011578_066680 [Streptomyces fuscichromogenes]
MSQAAWELSTGSLSNVAGFSLDDPSETDRTDVYAAWRHTVTPDQCAAKATALDTPGFTRVLVSHAPAGTWLCLHRERSGAVAVAPVLRIDSTTTPSFSFRGSDGSG